MTIAHPTDIKPVALEEEMKRSYLDYAMSVIVSRALPDVCDGLKPVHRRILYAMLENGSTSDKPHRKSSNAVGYTMMRFHPHGDAPIYDALVRLAQSFSLRGPLVDGQGNFGSVDGDPPAASRYTEARLAKLAHELLEDIEKDTVDFQPNYDDSTVEPKVLPARFPNLLVNGANGIAVGMATNIPTHNLGEVLDACCALIANPNMSDEDLMTYVPGPDFPTGAIILGTAGIRSAYMTGRGSIIIRSKTHIEKIRGDQKVAIVVDEIPFQVNKARMVERIAEVVKEKIVEGISDLRDESDRDGIRVVIELKKDTIPEVVLNQLFRHTPLQTSMGINMLAIKHGRPEQLSLMNICKAFLEFREDVIVRRTRYDLRKAREKAHLHLGLALAVANIDAVIALIRAAPDRQTAKAALMERLWPAETVLPLISLVEGSQGGEISSTYKLSEEQALAILDLRLHRLTGLERDKIAAELQELAEQIKSHLHLLKNRDAILALMSAEFKSVKEKFANPRRTTIEENQVTIDEEDLIQREDMIVTVSMGGYIKRVPLSTYRAQRRGGKGRSGMTTREEDVVSDIFIANTHSPILFFTSRGKVYQLKTHKLPLGSPTAKGRPMVNLLPLADNETISTVMILPDDQSQWEATDIFFATSKGNVRRNKLCDFTNIKSSGKIAMKLDAEESLISVQLCTEQQDILLATYRGKAIRFHVDEVRVFSGRNSNGVRGIRLALDDRVIQMSVVNRLDATTEEREAFLRQTSKFRQTDEEPELAFENSEDKKLTPERFAELALSEQFFLAVTEKGYGKRSSSYDYRCTGRGGQGIDGIIVNKRNGGVVTLLPVEDPDQIVLVSDTGQLIRCRVNEIRLAGRRTQGVTIFDLNEDERVMAVSLIKADSEEAEQTDGPEESID